MPELTAIGIFCASSILGIIGWLLIRVINNLDKSIDKMNNNQERFEIVIGEIQEKISDNDRRIYAIEIIHNIKGCINDTQKGVLNG